MYGIKELASLLLQDDSSSELLRHYLEIYATLPKIIEKYPFFGYLSSYFPVRHKVPPDMENDFDWDLLCSLVAASFSSAYAFRFETDASLPELYVNIESGDGSGMAKISDLSRSQIKAIMFICYKEQIQMQITLDQDNDKAVGVMFRRGAQYAKYMDIRKMVEIEIFRRMKLTELHLFLSKSNL
jgi:hypothetical protein